jgi:hypothetical protein
MNDRLKFELYCVFLMFRVKLMYSVCAYVPVVLTL